tara:strand:+ start:869 stop:1219 length:351 start_codon:yes stop_codon:yes gene_type:complete
MALGNSSSMGQARGRNKGTIVKRAKEYHDARNYYSIAGSTRAASDTCRSAPPVSVTYYHNGSASVPAVNDIMYTSKRARNPNTFTSGHYRIFDGTAMYFNIEVDSAGVITARTLCR